LRSSDLFEDRRFTRSVEDLTIAETGDIVGLTRPDKIGYRGIHIGMLLVDDSSIQLIHNARHVGQALVQSLEEARQHPHHSIIAWIKRPFVKNPNLANNRALLTIGLEALTL
jgi:hypothetical protein